jgi:tetratricopeptide (TPR) repeat protein
MFLTSFATFKIRHLFFNIVISKFKIGDFLKILKLPDELIHERVKIDQVSNDETFFNKHIVRFSKKERISQLLIKRYYEGIYRQNKDLLIAFIAVDYLHNSTLQIGYKDYLIETAIDILERIYAFNKDSKYILYFLGYYYLLDENYIKSKAFFNKYLNIDSNDLIGVAHLYYINFIEQTVQ